MRNAMWLAIVVAGAGGCAQDAPPAQDPAIEAAVTPDITPPVFPREALPQSARVYFVTPANGATVSSPVYIEFGVENVAIVPAGRIAPASGHHHLIVDAPLPPFDRPIPASENYLHFGDGSTSVTLPLAPGRHELRLLLGDHLHVPHDPPVLSTPITIIVTD